MNVIELEKSYRELSPTISYKIYKIKKSNGKFRTITAPNESLKEFQKNIMLYLEQFPIHNSAHGFVSGRSIATNALPHIKKDFVLNIDLKDFFPSISKKMIFSLFAELGIERYIDYVLHNGFLAQGSPCSPIITNLYCCNLDKDLQSLANDNFYSYTRYADDLTFSGIYLSDSFISSVYNIVNKYRLNINKKKTKVQFKGTRQVVTGVVVNEKINLQRSTKKRIRAMYHQYDSLTEYEKQYLAGMNGLQTVLDNAAK